jgi:hypothetical protein
MGLFDSFCDKCPNCSEELEVQVKFFNPYMKRLTPGDSTNIFNVQEQIIDLKFVASDSCENCGCIPIVVVRNKVFVGFESPVIQEQQDIPICYYKCSVCGNSYDDIAFNEIKEANQFIMTNWCPHCLEITEIVEVKEENFCMEV